MEADPHILAAYAIGLVVGLAFGAAIGFWARVRRK